MPKIYALLFAALSVAGCSLDPCSGSARAGFVASGGPLGLLAMFEICPEPAPEPSPVAAVPAIGLVEQPAPPDMGAVADLEQPAPDMTPICALPDLWYTDGLGRKLCGKDTDLDGIVDVQDVCPTLQWQPNMDTDRKGCPAPGYYTIDGHVLDAESGSWSLANNVWTSAPIMDWMIFRPIPSVLAMRVQQAQTSPADLMLVEFSWSGTVDMGKVTTQPECVVLKYNNGLMDFVPNPSDPTTKMCEVRTFYAQIFDEAGNLLGGGAECPLQAGSQIINCKMAFGQQVPLVSGAPAFIVKFFAQGAVSLSDIQVTGKVQVALH